MTRFFSFLTVGLLAGTLYSQDCSDVYCISGNVYTLLNFSTGCYNDAPATDFVDFSQTDCALPPMIAVYRESETLSPGFEPNFIDRDTIRFNYDDDETLVLSVFLKDVTGAMQSCETFALVSSIECEQIEPAFTINGRVFTENNEPIAGVAINLSGGVVLALATNDDGYYGALIPFIENTHVTPSRHDNPLNGVSTFDLVLISKHILGLQPLDSPYKRIAADVNGSGTITVLDLIQIRKLILNLIDSFPNTPSWRFVSAQYAFPVPLNPWHETFPETITITDPLNFVSGDFVGIKIGDVNGSAETH